VNVRQRIHAKVCRLQRSIRTLTTVGPLGGALQKRAEAAVRQSEVTYRMLFQEMQNGFAHNEIICDSQGRPINSRYLAINPAFERITGKKAEDVVGKTLLEIFPGLEPEWIETFGKVALTGEPAHFEMTASELGVCFEVTAFRPAPNQYACTFSDITESKKAEAALAEEVVRRGILVEQSSDGIVVIDHEGKVYEANRRYAEMLGYTPEEILQLHVWDWDTQFTREELLEMIGQVDAAGAHFETLHRRKDGTFYDVEISTNGAMCGGQKLVFCVCRDITERKQAAAEREELQAQFTQAQKMDSVGRLAGGVAHDFNNLLTGILNYTELCREAIAPEHPIRAWLDEIACDAERSVRLTRQLLAFARKQVIAPTVLDINDSIANILTLLRRLIGEDITIAWRPGSDVWPVKMDSSQIDQILANLTVNARDAIGGVGSLSIETSNTTFNDSYCAAHPGALRGDYMQLTVIDNGCGMDRDTVEHIFEPFFTTKGVGEGTGLGMATVYGIVKQNGGFINVYSEPGEGTTFEIHLPRCAAAESTQLVTTIAPEPPRGNETILLVEDEKSVRITARIFLEGLGYTVLAAEDPEQALSLAAQHLDNIELLITDVIMPGMSGRHMAQRLSDLRPTIKHIFISGFTADIIAQQGVLEEGVNFLPKPFGRDALARKVREVLDT